MIAFDDYYHIIFKDGDRVFSEKLRTDSFKTVKESLDFFVNSDIYSSEIPDQAKLVEASWQPHYFIGGEAQKELDKKVVDSSLNSLYGKTMAEIKEIP